MKKREITFMLFSIAAVFFLITAVNFIESGGRRTSGYASSVATVGLFVLGDQQTIDLKQGWNFISFYVILDNYSVSSVLQPIDGYYDYIQEWNGDTQDFKIWSRLGQKDFTSFNQNKSYFIYLKQDTSVTLDGDYFGNWTIGLIPGWETPDYVYEFNSSVTGNEFYNATFSYIQKWDNVAQEFLAYSPLAATNPFDKILPSEGYLIRTEGGNVIYVRV